VKPVEESNHLHKIGQRLKETIIFLVGQLSLHVNIPHKDQAGKGQDLFFAPAELGVVNIFPLSRLYRIRYSLDNYSGKFIVRVPKSLHKRLVIEAQAEEICLIREKPRIEIILRISIPCLILVARQGEFVLFPKSYP
jgi:hypothetical protein